MEKHCKTAQGQDYAFYYELDLFKIKRLKLVKKISSKAGHGGVANMYVKITKDENTIIFGHNKQKKFRKLLNKTSVSLRQPID